MHRLLQRIAPLRAVPLHLVLHHSIERLPRDPPRGHLPCSETAQSGAHPAPSARGGPARREHRRLPRSDPSAGRDGTGRDRTGLSALTALPAAMAAAQRRTAPTPSVAPNPLRVDAAQGSAPHSRLMGALSPLPPADGADLSIVPCTAPHSVGPGADAASAGGRGTALPPPHVPHAPIATSSHKALQRTRSQRVLCG